MSLAIAALFVMVIVSVLGVLWVAKRNRERVARFNNFGSAPAEVQKPATR